MAWLGLQQKTNGCKVSLIAITESGFLGRIGAANVRLQGQLALELITFSINFERVVFRQC